MAVTTFKIEATVAVGFGCAIYDWQFPLLFDVEQRETFKFIVAEGDAWTHGALFLEHLGVDFRELRAGLHKLVCECVWDEDSMGEIDLYFNFVSIEAI
jgi:hypothetical protein